MHADLDLWGVRVSTAPVGGMARIVRLSAIGIRNALHMVSVCQTEAANAMLDSGAIIAMSVKQVSMVKIATWYAVTTKRAWGLVGVGVTVNVTEIVNMAEMWSGAHAFALTDLPARIAKGVLQEYLVRIVTWSAAEGLPALGTEVVAAWGMAHAVVMMAS